MRNELSVLITFLGNINYDSRSLNFYNSFKEKGHKVQFIGFDWLTENFGTVKGDVTIFRLKKSKFSFLYYIKFSLVLLNSLIKNSYDIYFAEDIYTLPLVCIIAKWKKAKIFYDSREVYTHLAGLRNKRKTQLILTFIEKKFITKVDTVITTGNLDSKFLEDKYNIKNTTLVRNLPIYKKSLDPVNLREKFKIDSSKRILLYQGIVVHGRGLKIIFDLLKNENEYVLVIIGDGEYKKYYEQLAKDNSISHKICFLGKIKQENLLDYTLGADIGLSLIENISLSYYYALPNKLFEYIMAEIPVVVSNFPQMDEVINKYKVGISVDPENLDEIKASLNKFSDKNVYDEIKENCRKASFELNWENEFNLFYKKIFI